MNIAYLTTSLPDDVFNLLVSASPIKPNPAGQNFHAKAIRSLALVGAHIDVYSMIPIPGYVESNEIVFSENLTYHLMNRYTSRLKNKISLVSHIVKAIESTWDKIPDILLYDSLNLTLSTVAMRLKKAHKLPVVAFLTDDPVNLSSTSDFYQKQVIKVSQNADGYIALTEGLVRRFHSSEIPSLRLLGFVDPVKRYNRPVSQPYDYYGGALFEKDISMSLLYAYSKAKPRTELFIAGHGPLDTTIKTFARSNPRIHFLGQIPKETHYTYVQNANITWNPRTYRKSLDEFSVPSKVLEYLAYSPCIVSSYSQSIDEEFHSNINWLSKKELTGSPNIEEFFKNHLSEQGDWKDLIPNQAQEKILRELGPLCSGEKMLAFLQGLLSR